MEHQEMTEILVDLHQRELELRNGKGAEYTAGNPFENFEWGSDMLGMTREQVAWSYMVKHLTSIRMHVEGVVILSPEQLEEKVGDARLYLGLIYGMEVDSDS